MEAGSDYSVTEEVIQSSGEDACHLSVSLLLIPFSITLNHINDLLPHPTPRSLSFSLSLCEKVQLSSLVDSYWALI